MARSIPRYNSFVNGSSAAREGLENMRRKKADYYPPTEAAVLDWTADCAQTRKGRRAIKSAIGRVGKQK